MSKIFEALKKAGEVADVDLPINGKEPEQECQPVVGETVVEASAPAAYERLRSPGSSAAAGLPVIGEVALHPPEGAPILPFDGLDSRAAEQYKIIRTRILQHIRRLQFLMVSSAQTGDGKTTSAINIAAALALKSDVTVLFVDADFRRSGLPQLLGVPASPGLTEVIAGRCLLREAIVRAEAPHNLYLLPAGERPGNPTELLDSQQWTAVCEALRKQFSFIVADAPPVGFVADYDLIQAVSDGVILIVRPDHTNRSLCFKALQTIPKDKLIGVVVNQFEPWFLTKSFGHDYSYYSGDHA